MCSIKEFCNKIFSCFYDNKVTYDNSDDYNNNCYIYNYDYVRFI